MVLKERLDGGTDRAGKEIGMEGEAKNCKWKICKKAGLMEETTSKSGNNGKIPLRLVWM